MTRTKPPFRADVVGSLLRTAAFVTIRALVRLDAGTQQRTNRLCSMEERC